MFIRVINKKNGPNGKTFAQFALAQNARIAGKVQQRTLLYLNFNSLLLDPDNRRTVLQYLKHKIFKQSLLFELTITQDLKLLADSYYAKFIEAYGEEPLDERVSFPPAKEKADLVTVDLNTLESIDVKTFGNEHLCLQTLDHLKFPDIFRDMGWKEDRIDMARIAVCARAIFTSSELKTSQFLRDNSELCAMVNKDHRYLPTHKDLYRIADQLYEKREIIDNQLYNNINELFDIHDKILIFDVSNSYFESPKFDSDLAHFGQCKSKRKDCKIVVFTGVINQDGFIKSSRIYEGNKPDAATLGDMIADLERSHQGSIIKPRTIVMDAGIATDENCALIRSKGYDYVAVSRTMLSEYTIDRQHIKKVSLKSDDKTNIELCIVNQKEHNDTWMYVKSPGKFAKEQSIFEKLSSRFIQEVEGLKQGLSNPKAKTLVDSVNRRLGRIIEKYKRVAHYYDIQVISGINPKNNKLIANDIIWTINEEKKNSDKLNGVYFIRTSHAAETESVLWDIYNCIRSVESTFRCFKTDLNVRPIFHKNDHRVQSHIYLTVLAYQLVNTIRYQLKQKGITLDWNNIRRLMSTQIISTFKMNTDKKLIHLRKPSIPTNDVNLIYDACGCDNTIKPKKQFVVYH